MRKYYFSLKNNLHRLAFASLLFTLSQLNAQVGIGTTNPQAMLEVYVDPTSSSNNKTGFLVPRVNNLSTDNDIPAGMMVYYAGDTSGDLINTFYVYHTIYGWQTIMDAGSQPPVNVGQLDIINNGVVIWVNPANSENYILVSLTNLSNSSQWSQRDDDIQGAESDSDGYSNTLAWIAEYGQTQTSASSYLCYVHNGTYQNPDGWYAGTYADWNNVYANLNTIQNTLSTVNGADLIETSNRYWSSEQESANGNNGYNEAYAVQLSGGIYQLFDKQANHMVRAFKEIGGD